MGVLVVIVGPTAVGKSAIGVRVAELIKGEVISGDSMQVYRGMDIGTAKISPEEMRGIPHHLIDTLDPSQPFSVAVFQKQVQQLIGDIDGRGKIPLLVGGTGLYVQSVMDNYDFTEMGVDIEYRNQLRKEAESMGPGHLHRELERVDPEAAARIHPHDQKRMIRALEVYHQTGRPISSFGKNKGCDYHSLRFGITMTRELLNKRVEDRVDRMFALGLVDEVRQLLNSGYSPTSNAMQGLGYKQVVGYIRGDYELDEAVRLVKRETRRFAKRQMTWFRRDPQITWFDVGERGPDIERSSILAKTAADIACLIGRTINKGIE